MSDKPTAGSSETAFYETDKALSEYLLFHYGTPAEILPYPFGPREALDFAVRAVSECADFGGAATGLRALDIGCAVGRSSFELARHCSEVIGIDYSARFIAAAEELRTAGRLHYRRFTEGDTTAECEAVLPSGIEPERVRFDCCDAMTLPGMLRELDLILCANLVDRLPDPARFLKSLAVRMNAGGQLVITSPYTWTEEYTPRSAWLNRETGNSFEGLRSCLEPDFELVARCDLPFLIREHNRKYQWSVADATTWRRL